MTNLSAEITDLAAVTADNPTWHVLGAGSIGCLFAAYLQRAGRDVVLLLRDDAALTLLQQRGGIRLEHDSQITEVPVRATAPAAVQGPSTPPITHVLICTKAQQTLAAINSIKAQLVQQPVLVLLQNGMGVRERLLQAIPDAIVLHAITTEGAYQRERFQVVHAGRGETLIGSVMRSEARRVQAVVNALQCELPIAVATDIEQRLWLKLAVNSAINPLTALHECRNGELLQLPDIETTVTQLCAEFARVAAAEGQHFAVATLRETTLAVMRNTAANRSSMLQDLQAQRRTEIDFINGFIVARARLHGIACPQQSALFEAIKQREQAFALLDSASPRP